MGLENKIQGKKGLKNSLMNILLGATISAVSLFAPGCGGGGGGGGGGTTPVNTAPVLNAIGPKAVNEGDLLRFTISATDADGDTPTYSAVGLPTGATLDSNSGVFTWAPTFNDGTLAYNVNFTANDGNGGTDNEIVTITANDVANPKGIMFNTNYPSGAFIFNTYSVLPDGNGLMSEGEGVGVRPRWYPGDNTKMTYNKLDAGVQAGFLTNTDGTNPVKITTNTTHDVRDLAVSPDGSMIAWEDFRNGSYWAVWIADWDGTNLTNERKLTSATDEEQWPIFDNNSQKVYFQSRSGGGEWDIYRVNSDGTTLENLTSTISVSEIGPDVSPTGRLSYTSDQSSASGKTGQVVIADADGSNPVQLTNISESSSGDSNGAFRPSWSDDENWISYTTGTLTGSTLTNSTLDRIHVGTGYTQTLGNDSGVVYLAPNWER